MCVGRITEEFRQYQGRVADPDVHVLSVPRVTDWTDDEDYVGYSRQRGLPGKKRKRGPERGGGAGPGRRGAGAGAGAGGGGMERRGAEGLRATRRGCITGAYPDTTSQVIVYPSPCHRHRRLPHARVDPRRIQVHSMGLLATLLGPLPLAGPGGRAFPQHRLCLSCLAARPRAPTPPNPSSSSSSSACTRHRHRHRHWWCSSSSDGDAACSHTTLAAHCTGGIAAG